MLSQPNLLINPTNLLWILIIRALLLPNQYILIISLIVIILKSHYSSFEWIVSKTFFILVFGECSSFRNFDEFFEEVGCHYDGVRKKLSKVFAPRNSFILYFRIFICLKVRIPWTIGYIVAHFFATNASNIFLQFLLNFQLILSILILIIFLALMLRKLASNVILISLTTAPPHFTTILWPMSSTTPVEILFFEILFATFFAYFLVMVQLESTIFKFDEAKFHFVSFHEQLLV